MKNIKLSVIIATLIFICCDINAQNHSEKTIKENHKLQKSKDSYSVLITKASAFYQAKEYKKSGQLYLSAFSKLDKQNKITDAEITNRFNAACSFSLANNKEAAFKQLFHIANQAYSNFEQLTKDADLNNLHSDIRWNKLKEKINANYQLVKPLSKEELKVVFDNYQKAESQVFKAGSNIADIDKLYQYYTADFTYNHPKYGGLYSRQLLYNNTIKFQSFGRYKDSKKKVTLKKIIGLNAIVIEQKKVGETKTTMTLFEFRKDKISSIREYW